ncbi:Zinc-regulated transporter 2 [Apiospora phragmitis]|uniref:Zinc-regulated transporter 2 n=1 Tax=Apiospora phragmitis TaxID=2905665 RepID=A0ABR1SU66_9PEZI
MAEAMEDVKPQCGSDKESGEYDLPLHVVALFLVLTFSIFGAGFPVACKKLPWLKVPEKIFFFCKHFGIGVLIATAFVHLLPTAFGSLTDPCLPDLFIKDYPPMPGVIMMGSMFCLFVVEMWLNAKMGGHSHGGAKGFEAQPSAAVMNQMAGMAGAGPGAGAPPRPPRYDRNSFSSDEDASFEKRVAQKMYEDNARFNGPNSELDLTLNSEMPPWFVVFYEQYVRQRLEMMNMIKQSGIPYREEKQMPVVTESSFDVEGQDVDPMVYKKMSMNITLLEGGILFHSVFVGMTVSITIEGFIILLIAILFHQMFEGLGLGSRIAAVPYPKGSIRPWLLVFAFGTTAPIGQAIGLATRGSYDPNSAFGLIILLGFAYLRCLVDLLAEDFLSEEAENLTKKEKTQAFCCVLLGAAGMSIVGAFA